ncbi:PD-(D/E)XK nuclease family protein [Neobacillus sp. D3-1R]|uniref:PD-(D/E)XK nuclease family protein n=1 Tax=Neobacillus sp. D3-1R TaxID=3445778 RepID=UPI003F9F0EAC
MVIQEYPVFSWSNSRHKTALECAKKYYHSYYGFHNGWLKDSDAITKHIYRLKKLTNLEMFVGERVHKFIEDTAKGKHLFISEKEAFNHIWIQVEEVIDCSFSDYNKWFEKPSRINMLHEVYYEDNVSNEKISNLRERLIVVIHNLYENEIFVELLQKKINVHPHTEQFRFMSKDGIKIWLRVDLLYRDRITGDNLILVDWKTGKSDDNDRNQLALYSHFVSKAYKVSELSKIKIRNEYLLNNESKSYSVKPIDIDNMKELINMSINYMQSFLEEVDKNIPLPSSCFSQTSNQEVCRRCNFKEMCGIDVKYL